GDRILEGGHARELERRLGELRPAAEGQGRGGERGRRGGRAGVVWGWRWRGAGGGVGPMANLRATEVFVPTDFPTYTYVARDEEKLEKALRNAFETPKTAISVSGPSKSGKTVLVQRVLGEDNIIPIYGAQISSPEEVWSAILHWIEAPSSVTEEAGASESITPNATASAKLKVPGFAEV